MSPGQLHIVNNIYNRRETFVTSYPASSHPGGWTTLSQAGQPRGYLDSSLLHLGFLGVIFVCLFCFVFKDKANADLLFLGPKGKLKRHFSTLCETCSDKWNQLSQDMTHHQECFLGMKWLPFFSSGFKRVVSVLWWRKCEHLEMFSFSFLTKSDTKTWLQISWPCVSISVSWKWKTIFWGWGFSLSFVLLQFSKKRLGHIRKRRAS